MLNTIVAGNTGTANHRDILSTYNITSLGNNLIGDGSDCHGLTNGTNGDQVGTDATPIYPPLGPLAANDGPAIGAPGNTQILQTRALLKPGATLASLSADLSSSDMSMTVDDACLLSVGLVFAIDGEQMTIRSLNGTTVTVTRGASPEGHAHVRHLVVVSNPAIDAGVTPVLASLTTPLDSSTNPAMLSVTDASLLNVDEIVAVADEQLLITALDGTTATVTRPVNGTMAASHAVGANVNLATDERGFTRIEPLNPTFDIGAYEAIPSGMTPTVTASDAGGTYNGSPFTAMGSAVGTDGQTAVSGTFTFTYTDTLTGNTLLAAPVNAGNYSVVAQFQSSDPNYSGADSAPVSFTISPAALNIDAASDSKPYDGTTSDSKTPTYQVTGLPANTLYDDDSFTMLTQAFQSKNALVANLSTLAVNSDSISDGNPIPGDNYVVTPPTTAVGTIMPALLSITAVANTKTYDGTTSAAGVPTITAGSLGAGDTPNFIETYSTAERGHGPDADAERHGQRRQQRRQLHVHVRFGVNGRDRQEKPDNHSERRPIETLRRGSAIDADLHGERSGQPLHGRDRHRLTRHHRGDAQPRRRIRLHDWQPHGGPRLHAGFDLQFAEVRCVACKPGQPPAGLQPCRLPGDLVRRP